MHRLHGIRSWSHDSSDYLRNKLPGKYCIRLTVDAIAFALTGPSALAASNAADGRRAFKSLHGVPFGGARTQWHRTVARQCRLGGNQDPRLKLWPGSFINTYLQIG